MRANHPRAQYHLKRKDWHEQRLRQIMRQAAVGDEQDVTPKVKRCLRWIAVAVVSFCVFVLVMYGVTQ